MKHFLSNSCHGHSKQTHFKPLILYFHSRKWKSHSHVRLFAAPCTVHGILEWVAFPFSRGSSNPGIEPKSLALQADSLPTEQSEKHSSSLLQHIKPGNSEPTCLAHMSPPQRSPPDQCMFTHAFHPASCHSTWHYLALYWASLVAQMVKNPPEMREIQIQPLGQEDPLDEGNNYQYS